MKNLSVILVTILCFAVAALAAGIDGTWNVVYETEAGALESPITYKTNGSKLSVVGEEGELEVGTVKDGEFSYTVPDFYAEAAGYRADLNIEGKIEGDKISGTWEWDSYEGAFTGTRSK